MGAFMLSFVALRDFAVIAGVRPGLAPVLPLVIDLAIGVATLALVAIGDKPARRTRNATGSAAATAAPSVITATSKRDAPTATPAAVAMTDRDNQLRPRQKARLLARMTPTANSRPCWSQRR